MIPLVLFDTSYSLWLVIALQTSSVGAVQLPLKILEISLTFMLVVCYCTAFY